MKNSAVVLISGRAIFYERVRRDHGLPRVMWIGWTPISVAVPRFRVSMALGLFEEELQVKTAVVAGEKDILAVVAPLGDVMRNARKNDSRDSRHRR